MAPRNRKYANSVSANVVTVAGCPQGAMWGIPLGANPAHSPLGRTPTVYVTAEENKRPVLFRQYQPFYSKIVSYTKETNPSFHPHHYSSVRVFVVLIRDVSPLAHYKPPTSY